MPNHPPDKLFDDSPQHPGDYLRDLLESKGWTQDDLAAVTGKSRQQINDIVTKKRGISPDMAIVLAAAFNQEPRIWLGMDAAWRLSQAQENPSPVSYRAKLYDMAPIKDMQRRGWISPSKDIVDIESELRRFYGADSLEAMPEFPVSTRKTAALEGLSPAQQAWCFRARQLSQIIRTKRFNPKKISEVKKNLRILAKYPKNVIHVPELLGDNGIRFVVIEHLPGAKIDGAAFWLTDDCPVIAMSVRYDRIDAFWHTLMA